MQNNVWKKGLVLGIILIFFCAGVLPSVSGDIENRSNSVLNQTNGTASLSSSSVDWWPMFNHDLNHSGCSKSQMPNNLSVLWTFSKLYDIGFSAAVVDDKVYISVFTGGDNGWFYCLNAETGDEIWRYKGEFYSKVFPCVYEGMVYFTAETNQRENSTIYCLNADTGELIWDLTKNCGNGYGAGYHPVATDGKLFFDFGSASLFCLNAQNGKEIWEYDTGRWINSCPAIANGYVYFTSTNGNLYCLNVLTGEKKWIFQTLANGYEQSSPTFWNGNVYLASLDHNIYCLDASTGAKKWIFTTNDWNNALCVTEGKVYVGSDDNNIYCLDAQNGQHLWTFSSGGDVCSIALADGNIYFSTSPGDENETSALYCLNMETGKELWRNFNYSALYPYLIIANEKMYLCAGSHFYCFAAEGNRPPIKPSKPIGLTNGKIGVLYPYSSSTSDPNDDQIYYWFDWGDGTNTGWIGPFASGMTINANHTWTTKNTYSIKVKAKDINGAESVWSDPLPITMPHIVKPIWQQFLDWLFQRFPNAFPVLRQLIRY